MIYLPRGCVHNHISILGFLAATINILFHFYTLQTPSPGAPFTSLEVGRFFIERKRRGNKGCVRALTKGESGDEPESSYTQPK